MLNGTTFQQTISQAVILIQFSLKLLQYTKETIDQFYAEMPLLSLGSSSFQMDKRTVQKFSPSKDFK